jgi:hypothetical protein
MVPTISSSIVALEIQKRVGFCRRAALRLPEILYARTRAAPQVLLIQDGGDHRISPTIALRTARIKQMACNKLVATFRMSVLIEGQNLPRNTACTASDSHIRKR